MILRIVVQIFFAGVLASTALMTTHAQNPPPDTPAPTRVDQQRGIDPDFEQRKNDMRLLDKTMHPRDASKNNIRKRRDPKVVAEEIAEDFTRLQVVNNELGQAVSAPVPLKLEFVIKSAAELAERSHRFGENLGHPEADKDSKPRELEALTDVEELKHALVTLDNLITEFAHNPLFTDASTRDAELLLKARLDLAEINSLSEHIRKSAETLSKTAQHSP